MALHYTLTAKAFGLLINRLTYTVVRISFEKFLAVWSRAVAPGASKQCTIWLYVIVFPVK